MAINTVVKFKFEKKALQLKSNGCSDKEIATELSALSGEKISRSAVYRYFSSHHEVIKDLSPRPEILATNTIKLKLDVAGTILENIKKTDEALEAAVLDHAWAAVARILAERRMNTETAAKIAGMLAPNGASVNIQTNTKVNVTIPDDELERKARDIISRRTENTD